MNTKPSRTTATRMQAAITLINNSLNDPEILELVSAYGYTTDRLNEGLALHTQATAAISAQAAAAGAQRAATLRATAAEKQSRAEYTALARIIRAIFTAGSAERRALGIQGPTPDSEQGFIAAATKLYDNALSVDTIRDTLATYGYNAQRLAAERATVNAFVQARQGQIAAISAAVEATAAQTAALDTLARWVSRYLAIVTTALQHNPQLRERLGMPLRSSGAARRPAAVPEPTPAP